VAAIIAAALGITPGLPAGATAAIAGIGLRALLALRLCLRALLSLRLPLRTLLALWLGLLLAATATISAVITTIAATVMAAATIAVIAAILVHVLRHRGDSDGSGRCQQQRGYRESYPAHLKSSLGRGDAPQYRWYAHSRLTSG
jgi:NADH:ubiquinone oxidoreductase subunit K